MRILPFISLAAMAACASGPATISGPAVDAALALPPAQFTATLVVAAEVANGCPSYTVSARRSEALTAARAADAGRAGITLETDVTRRSFQARYGVVIGQENTCAAIEAAIADGAAISAVWVPA